MAGPRRDLIFIRFSVLLTIWHNIYIRSSSRLSLLKASGFQKELTRANELNVSILTIYLLYRISHLKLCDSSGIYVLMLLSRLPPRSQNCFARARDIMKQFQQHLSLKYKSWFSHYHKDSPSLNCTSSLFPWQKELMLDRKLCLSIYSIYLPG